MRHVSSLCAGFLPMKENDGFGVRFLTAPMDRRSFSSLLHGTDDDWGSVKPFSSGLKNRPTLGLILE